MTPQGQSCKKGYYKRIRRLEGISAPGGTNRQRSLPRSSDHATELWHSTPVTWLQQEDE